METGVEAPRSPRLEVIIPVFNGGPQLSDCVNSVLHQSLPSSQYTLTVVDNLSTDGEIAAMKELPIRVISEEVSRSSYSARNKGIRESRADIIVFTDADCVADPGWLSALLARFDDRDVVAVGGKVLGIDSSSPVSEFLNSIELFEHYNEDRTFHLPLLTNNVAFRRSVLVDCGLFREHWYTGADVELAWRLQLLDIGRVVYEPRAIIYHHHRSTLAGLASQFRRHGFGEILLDATFGSHPGYGRPPRHQLNQMLRQVVAILTYCRSIVYRSLVSLLRQTEPTYAQTPRYWLVAETATLVGKLQGLWTTRFFQRNPLEGHWTDPRKS